MRKFASVWMSWAAALFVLVAAAKIANGFTIAEVELKSDIWGEVTFTITDNPEKDVKVLKCLAKNSPDPVGTFRWTLGSQTVHNDDVYETISEEDGTTTYAQVFNYQPKLDDDNQRLECVYTQVDSGMTHEPSIHLDLHIQKHVLPSNPFVVAGTFNSGLPVRMPVTLKMFPEPKAEDVVWMIEDSANLENNIELGPGETQGQYSTSQIKATGDNEYESVLTIDPLSEDERTKSYYLVLKANDNRRLKVEFLRAREAAPTTKSPIEESTTLEPDQNKLGAGLWVIIALVLIIILACIGYFIYQKFVKEKPEPRSTPGPTDPEKGAYSKAPTNET